MYPYCTLKIFALNAHCNYFCDVKLKKSHNENNQHVPSCHLAVW